MIRVEIQPEPDGFDAAVRQPGLRALRELLGIPSEEVRRGRPRTNIPGHTQITAKNLENADYWTECIPDLHRAYGGLCAYLALFFPGGTGPSPVYHSLSKNVWIQQAQQAKTGAAALEALQPIYAWSNYRLSSLLMNARKGDSDDVLAPACIEDHWFILRFTDLSVQPGEGLTDKERQAVENTITRLSLNDSECCRARAARFDAYIQEDISLRYLAQRSPFVAREARRQGLLRETDLGEE